MIQFIVNISPLSQNKVYRRRNAGGLYMTQEGHDFKNQVGWQAKEAMGNLEYFLNPSITIRLYYDNNRRNDIDGAIKLLLDAMNKIVYNDDKDILELHVYKEFDPYAHIEIEVEET